MSTMQRKRNKTVLEKFSMADGEILKKKCFMLKKL